MNALEKDLRRVMRDLERFPLGSVSFVEPGKGADFGLPDTFVVIDGHHVALELKRGNSVVRELRPTQRMWHKTAILAGARTFGATLKQDGQVMVVQILLPGGTLGSPLAEKALDSIPLHKFCYACLVALLR